MNQKEVHIRKAENGYVVKTIEVKDTKSKNVNGMLNLMKTMGMYESWNEHKEEDIRRSLEQMAAAAAAFPEREEKEVICSSLSEVDSFLKKFFEATPPDTIRL